MPSVCINWDHLELPIQNFLHQARDYTEPSEEIAQQKVSRHGIRLKIIKILLLLLLAK